ncbi:protein NSP-INTERACTING KINASE 3-like [Panicum hallii]|uniref:protein NSP-INTERACTING KINASE 3-like n=1 Tax=Panicum hallii TaxID=206008 RepID=UPI000DF4EFFC|nr:protein NSP-INTERACTING KINASE 3-like [Panicum hallii]
MVTCNQGQVYELSLRHQNLSGTLSPAIRRLRSLQNLYLCNNAISGPIPDCIGSLEFLRSLDLSNNQFTGSIPSTLGGLSNLLYLKLNNNSLSGLIPDSLAAAPMICTLDLSFNNLSGTWPIFQARITVLLGGNPLLTAPVKEPLDLLASKPMNTEADSESVDERVRILSILALCVALVCVATLVTGVVMVFRHGRQREQVAAEDVQQGPEVWLGHLKHFKFKDIKRATNNFSRRNILGEGGYGIVYKGCLLDGTIVAVKRLKHHVLVVGDDQFHTEVGVIGLVVHRNLLHLTGFCTTNDERLLVYPYMPNGTVASKLHELVNEEPALDWSMRKSIALSVARGLLYLHEQCIPKIIHRDIKASNILLDEHLEAVIADFGLAKLVDLGVSHVITEARGTLGRIPPESLMSGHSSDKSDVFGFGFLLIELVTGRETLELHQNEYVNGGILDWAKELLEQNQLSSFVDMKIRNNYDSVELEEMVQIALLCTMYKPEHRPRMSEVVRMLEEGDGVAEKWEAMKDVEELDPDSPGYLFPVLDYDVDRSSSIELQAIELSGPR